MAHLPHDALVSIVLPTYNGEQYLRQSIASCLAQTYPRIELIVVDDGSTDRTPRIVAAFDDPRIRYIRHEDNRQLPRALNTGFAHARGDLLTWTSDDNWYVPTAITIMAEAMRAAGVDFVYANYAKHQDDAETPFAIGVPPDPFDPAGGVSIGACFLYTRQVMEAVGDYDPECFLAEDYDYWIRVSQQFVMRHIPRMLYHYRFHERSLTKQYDRGRALWAMSILVRVKNRVLDIPSAVTAFRTFLEHDGLDSQIRMPMQGLLYVWPGLRAKMARRYAHSWKQRACRCVDALLERYLAGRITMREACVALAARLCWDRPRPR